MPAPAAAAAAAASVAVSAVILLPFWGGSWKAPEYFNIETKNSISYSWGGSTLT